MQKARAKGLFDEEFRQNKIATKDPLVILSTKISWEQFRKTLEESFPEVDRSKGGRPAYCKSILA
jgi:hypothetical protein